MLTLSRPAEYSREVRPVCLDSSGRTYDGQDVTVAGWGSMYEGPVTLYVPFVYLLSRHHNKDFAHKNYVFLIRKRKTRRS